jgi:methylated-DNA-[protein]-cysteine S-methyltransferase
MGDGYTLFRTAIGVAAIAWTSRGISRVWLPEGSSDRLRARLQARVGRPPARETPSEVAQAIEGIVALLAGERRDLADIRLDLSGVPEFHRQVYDVARRIPPGSTLTYGQVADALHDPGAARAVGQALGRNPIPIIVPCHRVLAANGGWGGFSAPGGVATKQRLLAIEGAAAVALPLFDLADAVD